jgi:hypothetical protein
MKFSDLFGPGEQDDRIELMQKILEFREELYGQARKSKELANMAQVLMFSLIGAAHGYKPCCVFHFCVNAYFDIKEPLSISPVDGRILCPRCIEDEIPEARYYEDEDEQEMC